MKSSILLLPAAALLAFTVGCGKSDSAAPTPETAHQTAPDTDHSGHDHAGHDHAAPPATTPADDHAEHAGHDDHAEHAAAEHATPAADAATLALSLNDGAKWQMDDHTRKAIAALNALQSKRAVILTVSDANALGTAMDTQVKSLIEGCTMDGAAHDQLHIFLMAFMPAVESLKTAKDMPTAVAAQAQIKGLLTAYGAHFE